KPGRHLNYGVREFGMAAIMNGVALHGGFIPYGGTFLTFSDYSRNAIRMAALMKKRVIHVFTHDSIGLGEDGPTHQPVEHAASLRLIPNLDVWRPCDGAETAAAWSSAVQAVECAIALQAGLAERNRNVPPGQEIVARIGINLGIIFNNFIQLRPCLPGLAHIHRRMLLHKTAQLHHEHIVFRLVFRAHIRRVYARPKRCRKIRQVFFARLRGLHQRKPIHILQRNGVLVEYQRQAGDTTRRLHQPRKFSVVVEGV
ncbi:MAG: hypothetical protein K2Q01_03090, partial [Rickettsiales bacterium]|nr:hypothetical protein [Rickettsiales bacterium]